MSPCRANGIILIIFRFFWIIFHIISSIIRSLIPCKFRMLLPSHLTQLILLTSTSNFDGKETLKTLIIFFLQHALFYSEINSVYIVIDKVWLFSQNTPFLPWIFPPLCVFPNIGRRRVPGSRRVARATAGGVMWRHAAWSAVPYRAGRLTSVSPGPGGHRVQRTRLVCPCIRYLPACYRCYKNVGIQ